MRISEVARQAGVNVETIRFYEREGLLSQPPRPQHGYRNYSSQHVKRIRFLRRCQRVGFSLAEAAEIASLLEKPQSACQEACSLARRKLAEVRERIAAYQAVEQQLEELLERDEGEANCRLLRTLGRD